jgi:hypothetical protein
MILADTSIWIDHLRKGSADLEKLLLAGQIAMHPFVVAEIALGSLHNRRVRLSELDSLLEVNVARITEVRHMIETRSVYSRGLSLTDAHLILSCLMTPGTQLWTRDRDMEAVARSLSIPIFQP